MFLESILAIKRYLWRFINLGVCYFEFFFFPIGLLFLNFTREVNYLSSFLNEF